MHAPELGLLNLEIHPLLCRHFLLAVPPLLLGRSLVPVQPHVTASPPFTNPGGGCLMPCPEQVPPSLGFGGSVLVWGRHSQFSLENGIFRASAPSAPGVCYSSTICPKF